jgi:hypothetical protein
MTQYRPSGENPISWSGREDFVELYLPMVVVDLGDRIVILRVLVELNKGHRLEIVLDIEDALPSAQPHDG